MSEALLKSLSCSCGAPLIDHEGKMHPRSNVRFDGDTMYAKCHRCKGHSKIGKVEKAEEPEKEPAQKSRHGVKIVYFPGGR